MSSEVCRLDRLLEITSSKRIHLADYVSSGVPFFRGKEVIERAKGNEISTELFITDEKYREIKSKFGAPENGDILLTSVGTLGVAYFVDGVEDFYFKDGNVTWFRNYRDVVVPKFLYYWLTSPATQKRLDDIAIGSTQRALTISALKGLEILLPCVKLQKAIVEVLDSVSDRITLLRETNATLEAIAQALFKSWFVDFDPVRAKAEGRQPEGMDATTAALFPDSFEESELGLLPRGWQWSGLDNIADVTMGLSPKGDSYNSDGVGTPLINGPVEFGDYFPVQTKWTNMASRVSAFGDLIFCVRGSTTGRRVVADGEYCIGRGVCAIRSRYEAPGFIYQTINFGLDRLLAKTTGSVFPSLSGPDIKNFRVLNPSPELMGAYERITKSLLGRIQSNQAQAQTLTQLRDTLLPRLISGQLRLPDAEQLTEEAC